MKDLLVNLIASLIMTTSALVVQWAIKHQKGSLVELCAGIAAVTIVFSLFITLWFNRRRGKFLAAQKFDFKFFADTEGCNQEKLAKLFAMFGKRGVDDIGTNPLFAKPIVNGTVNPAYISAEEFFSASNEMLKNFRCRSVRNAQKTGKVFLQLSFIPIDSDSKTIAIRRSDIYHPGMFGIRFKNDLSFVSFSPVPPRYEATEFSVLDSYHNEVPMAWGRLSGVEPEIKELGAVVRKNKGAVYIFWVFAAKYPASVHFDGPAVDTKRVLDELFYENEKAVKDSLPFIKDHDTIESVFDVGTLKEYALNGTLPKLSWNPLHRRFWKCLRAQWTLRRLSLKDVEKCVFANFF